jgi:hypothetical protein
MQIVVGETYLLPAKKDPHMGVDLSRWYFAKDLRVVVVGEGYQYEGKERVYELRTAPIQKADEPEGSPFVFYRPGSDLRPVPTEVLIP